ncbi:MAG: hypothetical protein QM482_04865 [Sulfurospirillum sp.]
MILYDKKSNFLGMGQSELSILGYEDMEEFKSYFDDFADLFVNHPGYISKFKNFSWIDYALHSGAPNKNVLLKHKNGTDIETGLKISEISLVQPINNETVVYCIELGINTSSSDLTIKQNIKLSDTDTQEHVENTAPLKDEYHQQNNNDMHNFDKILVNDYKEEDKNTHLKTPIDKEETVEIIIKQNNKENTETNADNTIYNNSETRAKESFAEYKDKEKESYPARAKVVFNDEDDDMLKNKIEISSQNENNIYEEIDTVDTASGKNRPTSTQDIQNKNIDLTKIAEETGMDLGDIAKFLEEFIKEAKNYLQKINDDENLSNLDFVKDETIKLKGVASILKIINITNTLNSILQKTGQDKPDGLFRLLKKQIQSLEEQLF